jgi:hypothetical protein
VWFSYQSFKPCSIRKCLAKEGARNSKNLHFYIFTKLVSSPWALNSVGQLKNPKIRGDLSLSPYQKKSAIKTQFQMVNAD